MDLIDIANLPQARLEWERQGKSVVVTNGCFDVIHYGHVTYLQASRKLGDILLVGLNGDSSIAKLKGPGRPINTEARRAIVLLTLRSVDAVCLFHETRCTRFLAAARPTVYTKADDYTIETLNPEEKKALMDCGARIVFLPTIPGLSTTAIIAALQGTD